MSPTKEQRERYNEFAKLVNRQHRETMKKFGEDHPITDLSCVISPILLTFYVELQQGTIKV